MTEGQQEKAVLVLGSLYGGIAMVKGPFESADDAQEYADHDRDCQKDYEWCVVPLIIVEEDWRG